MDTFPAKEKGHFIIIYSSNVTYRPPLKVVVQRFVQQCSLAALLCAHQGDIDIVICPCKPLVPCGHSHYVIWHDGR